MGDWVFDVCAGRYGNGTARASRIWEGYRAGVVGAGATRGFVVGLRGFVLADRGTVWIKKSLARSVSYSI